MKITHVTYRQLFWTVVFASFLAGSVVAESPEVSDHLFDMSLEELMGLQITTVSRIRENLDDSPGTVHVYTANTIKKRGYHSLAELLRNVPGFAVFHRDLQFVAGVRGLSANDNEKITLLINGQQMNGANEPDILNGPINLDNVERVEVVVGPSSFFQQTNTLAATINVITRQMNGTELIFSTGSDVPYSATLLTGKEFDEDRSYSFSFTTEQKKGFDAWASDFRPNLAGKHDTGRLQDENFFSVLTGRNGNWSGQFTAYRTAFPELNINSGSALNDALYRDQFYSLFLKYEEEISSDLSSFFSIASSYKESSRIDQVGLPEPDSGTEQHISKIDYDAELGFVYTGLEKHMIQTGVQAKYEDNLDNWFTWNAVSGLPSFPQKTTLFDDDTFGVGFYLSDTYTASDKLVWINGIRMDLNTLLDYNWYVSGRSGVTYHVSDKWITKLFYNRSVRYPSQMAANNQVWGRGKSGPPWTRHFPNANKPEILSTLEWQNIYYTDIYRLGVTVYYQGLSDFISWSEPHSNVGDFHGYGVETEIQAQVREDLSLWANAAFNESELNPFNVPPPPGPATEAHHALVNGNNQIVGSARVTANLGVDWNLSEDVVFSTVLRYFTNQAAYDYTASDFVEIDDRYYLDVSLLWENAFGKDMDLRIAGTNILDNRDPIGGQWLGDTYRPRGAALLVSTYIRF